MNQVPSLTGDLFRIQIQPTAPKFVIHMLRHLKEVHRPTFSLHPQSFFALYDILQSHQFCWSFSNLWSRNIKGNFNRIEKYADIVIIIVWKFQPADYASENLRLSSARELKNIANAVHACQIESSPRNTEYILAAARRWTTPAASYLTKSQEEKFA